MQTIDLHDRIVSELFEKQSIAALIFLIEHGRELEFSYLGREGFLSKSGSEAGISLWYGQNLFCFDTMEQLLASPVLHGQALCAVWENIELSCLL